jgi:hypothetical protein
MRHSLAAIALVTLAAPAAAQGISAQYADAFARFSGVDPGAEMEISTAAAAMSAMIPGLAGNWVQIAQLAGNTGSYDELNLADHCRPLVWVLTPTSPWSFDLTATPAREGAPRLTVHHDYGGWNLFHRSRDTTAWLERLGLTDQARLPVGLFLSDGSQGRVRLFHPSPDIIVFLPEVGPAEFFARCPG